MRTDPHVPDAARLARLARSGLLDSPPDLAFDRLTRLATRLLGVPVALVSLVDAERQFFISQVGLDEPWASARETPLTHSFCQHTLGSDAPLVIEDARVSDLVGDSLAIPDLGVIAYLGIPLRTAEGLGLGSFCAIDSQPRVWTEDEIAIMRDLAAAAMTEVALREDMIARELAEVELRASEQRFRRAFADAPTGLAIIDRAGVVRSANHTLERLLGLAEDGLTGQEFAAYMLEEDRNEWRVELAILRAEKSARVEGDWRLRRADGSQLWTITNVSRIADDELMVQVQDVTERRRQEDELRWYAEHDAMTGLMNRRRFAGELTALVERGKRYGAAGALLLIDIDDFKAINDTRGHQVGDEVLVGLAGVLRSRARTSDAVARLGGDEFAILTPSGDLEAAQQLADALIEHVAERSAPAQVTVSIGIAALDSIDPLTPSEVQRHADQALYAAKAAGRNTWRAA